MKSKISTNIKRHFSLFLFLLSIPGVQAAQPEAGVFTFRIPWEPETLDWNRAHTPVETYLLLNLMEGLLTLDETLKVVPALAQSYSKSPDGKTYTFKIRPGLKWSDGAPLTAHHFAYSWKRLISPKTAASYAYLLFDVEGAKEFNQGKITDFNQVGIRALDDLTFQVRLTQPIAHWIYIPTFWVTFPLRPDVVEKHGESWTRPGKMVTAGPFTLVSHDLDSRIVLRSNPNYYGTKGNIQTAVALIVRDDSTALNLYESGKIDFLNDLSITDLQRLSSRGDLKSFPYLKTVYLGLVTSKFSTSNAKVRRAIGMAIDRSKFGTLLMGNQKAATSFIPPGILGHSAKVGLPYDPVRAKAELKGSGYSLSRAVSFELVSSNWDRALTITQYIQSELKKNLGIGINLQMFDHKTFRAQLDLKAYATFLSSWSADYPDPDNFASVFTGEAGNNRTGWGNSLYDSLVVKARSLLKSKERENEYLKAQKILQEDEAAIIPLYYDTNQALVKARVKGLVVSPVNYLYLKKVNLGL